MLNIGHGGFPRVIGRGRRREHPNQHCLLLLRVLCNFRLRMRTPKGTLNGSSDLWSHPVAMLLLLRKKRGEKRRTYFRLGPLQDRGFSGQKNPLGRILCNFRLRMRRTYFRTCEWRLFGVTWLTSLPVTWLTWLAVAPPKIRLCPYPYTTVVGFTTINAISACHH